MKIKSTHPASQGPFVLINDEDFDPACHQLFVEGTAQENVQGDAPKRRGRPPLVQAPSAPQEPQEPQETVAAVLFNGN